MEEQNQLPNEGRAVQIASSFHSSILMQNVDTVGGIREKDPSV